MSKDPVCGMQVHEKKAAAHVEWAGRIYFFCSLACKARFLENPRQYLKPGENSPENR